MAEYASGAEARGIEVIIAGAGGAAHLPGMVAAHTLLPVLGVPSRATRCKGIDSLLSIVQMPGGIPVGTLAIGKAGATNAALLAVAILPPPARSARAACAHSAPSRPQHVRAGHAAVRAADPPRRHARRARQRAARTHVRDRRAAAWATASIPSRPRATRRPARWPTSKIVGAYDDLDACAPFARSVDVVTFEFENVPADTAAAAAELRRRPARAASVLHTTQHRAAREDIPGSTQAFPARRFARVVARGSASRARASRLLRPSSRPPASATTAKDRSRIDGPSMPRRRMGAHRPGREPCSKPSSTSRRSSRSSPRAASTAIRALRRRSRTRTRSTFST